MKLDKGGGVIQSVETASTKRAATKDDKPEEKERKQFPYFCCIEEWSFNQQSKYTDLHVHVF